MRLDAVVLRGVADERAPAAADVEQAVSPGFRRSLRQIMSSLSRCARVEIVVPVVEIGAGIDHLRVEEERVEPFETS